MEDFRISNFLAREVEHFGQERAEQGAEVSPDGGDSGAAHGETYEFPEAQDAVEGADPFEDVDDAEAESQDDDTTAVAMTELDRIRFFMGSSGLRPELQTLRGQHYYEQSKQDPLRVLHLKDVAASESELDPPEIDS